jgi:uroporphyrinogen decarboxylase
MNSRERFLTTIQGGIPDRSPIIATFTPQIAEKMAAHLNLPYEEPLDSLLSTRISHMELLTMLGNDAVGVAACSPLNKPTIIHGNGIIENEWGMKFKNVGLYNEFIEFPLAHAQRAADIEKYEFPDPEAKGRFDAAQKAIDQYKHNFGIYGDLETSFFETAWYLVGLEKFLMDLMMEAEYIEPLLDKILEINTNIGKKLIEMGVDMIWAGDDFGGQNGLLIDPETWRRIFKPRIKFMFDEFKKVNPDIKIAWHSCGAIVPIIPDFIEIGLDILNPIQPLAKDMEPKHLKEEFGNDLIFFGGICVQNLLPNGTPEEIKNETAYRKKIIGNQGGYIIGPAHNVQNDTSIKNILAFFEEARKVG